MAKSIVKPRTAVRPKTKRPPLYKVILLNDDYTPREFVVLVLKAVFRMNEDEAYRVMMTAHRRGACVIAVYAKDVAETKAKEATELGKEKGYPLEGLGAIKLYLARNSFFVAGAGGGVYGFSDSGKQTGGPLWREAVKEMRAILEQRLGLAKK